jgi:signal transduction histidine kinase
MKTNSRGTASVKEAKDGRSSGKLLQQELTRLKEENRKLTKLFEQRAASLSHLGHELRTPLTSILGFAEILLSQEQLTPAQRNFCERIQNSANQLQATLNQLSELARAGDKSRQS